jgi:cell division protein FtsB
MDFDYPSFTKQEEVLVGAYDKLRTSLEQEAEDVSQCLADVIAQQGRIDGILSRDYEITGWHAELANGLQQLKVLGHHLKCAMRDMASVERDKLAAAAAIRNHYRTIAKPQAQMRAHIKELTYGAQELIARSKFTPCQLRTKTALLNWKAGRDSERL